MFFTVVKKCSFCEQVWVNGSIQWLMKGGFAKFFASGRNYVNIRCAIVSGCQTRASWRGWAERAKMRPMVFVRIWPETVLFWPETACRSDRFAMRYMPFDDAKRRVWPCDMGRFALPNAPFGVSARCRWRFCGCFFASRFSVSQFLAVGFSESETPSMMFFFAKRYVEYRKGGNG